jgi:hypothetical protein
MTRTKKVTARGVYGDLEVVVRIRTKELAADEARSVVSHLADKAMESIASAPYMHVSLSGVRVK